ncbi:MAG: lectin [Gammaproteobacteria bacterium]|jgi:hypothetical protein|nr:lectin [Gammaproteobacteria bacterium]
MRKIKTLLALSLAGMLTSPLAMSQAGTDEPMSFFITSVGIDGGNLGGLAGADAHCQALASAVGSGDKTWRAYLSTQGPNAVDARDRIGTGPWYGQAGHMVARDQAHLHGDTIELARRGNGVNPFHARTENGDFVTGVIDSGLTGEPTAHDILTGSTANGRAYTDSDDHTCSNWTSNNEGSAQLGHHDLVGFEAQSWNSDHPSAGCDQQSLINTGGAGLLYCFATD